MPSRRAARLPQAGALALGLALLAACGGATAAVPTSAGFHGPEPETEVPRASFVLQDTSGERFDFAAETAGRPTLLYFGYTHCPDECPTAMADIAAAVRRAPADVRDRLEVVFVTTDPERDTPEVLRGWLDRFAVPVTGLVGTPAELEAAQEAVGTAPARKEGPIPTLPGRPDAHEHEPGTAPHRHDGPLGYGVGHADVIFAYDAADRLAVRYPGGVLPADLAADLPALARPPVLDSQGDPS
jgi:protein SCO1/2